MEFEKELNILKDILLKVPNLEIKDIYQEYRINENYFADIFIRYFYFNEIREIIIEQEKNGEPRLIKNAINQLIVYKNLYPNAYMMVSAPYISENSAEICRKFNIGYLDYSGNIFINDTPLYINISKNSNRYYKKKAMAKLYSPKAERILRVLLESGKKEWLTEELANTAEVSIGLVAKVKKTLLDKEWLNSGYGGFYLTKPLNLLNEWAENYNESRNTHIDCYTLVSLREIEKKISQLLDQEGVRYAFTGQASGARYAPMVRYQRLKLYIENLNKFDEISEKLQIKTVNSGSNIQFLVPYDKGVFYGVNSIEDTQVVSQIQTYLDLINDKGRGKEGAEELLRNGIIEKWQ